MKKKVKVLVVVDVQNDFVDGALGTEEAQAIIPKVVEKIKQYKEIGKEENTQVSIVCTMDTHTKDYLQTQEGFNLPVPHCVRFTNGWLLNPDVEEALDDDYSQVEKGTFGSIKLAGALSNMYRANGMDNVEIEVIGLCTDICVVSNALLFKAYMPEVVVTVDASCCAGVTPEKHNAAIETMKSCQINIINE